MDYTDENSHLVVKGSTIALEHKHDNNVIGFIYFILNAHVVFYENEQGNVVQNRTLLVRRWQLFVLFFTSHHATDCPMQNSGNKKEKKQ